MAFKFESLKIWQRALEYSLSISELTKGFPKIEQFELASQMRRTGDSICLNIAEGSAGNSKKEFAQFLRYSRRSLIETVGCLIVAKRKGYVEEKIFNEVYSEAEELSKMISGFINSLR